MLFHLLLCLNQRFQIFNNDGFEVFHSFFLLRETRELNTLKVSGCSQTPIDGSHLKPADFFTYSFGDLFKVSLPLLDLPLQLKHRKHGTMQLPVWKRRCLPLQKLRKTFDENTQNGDGYLGQTA